MAFINIGLAIYAFGIFASASGSVADLASTWDATPLDGAVFINASTTSSCPSGYSMLNKNPYFAGIPDKCDCTNRVCPPSYYQGHSGKCTSDEKSTGCTESSTKSGSSTTYSCACTNRVCDTSTTSGALCTQEKLNEQCVNEPGFPAQEMPIWRGFKMCVRYGGPSVSTREGHSTDGVCETGWKNTCSTTQTNATVLCFPENVGFECPLSSIEYSPSTAPDPYANPFVVARDVGQVLPIIDAESATRTGGSWSMAYTEDGKTLPNKIEFQNDYFVSYDEIFETQIYAENGVPTRFADATKKYSMGFRRELGWKNDCLVSRKAIVGIIPEIDDLKTFLTLMLVIVILDFVWSIFESFKLADSLDFNILAIRTCADVIVYGANLPLVILATGAGGAIASRITDISGCAPNAALTASFITVGDKARSLSQTNIIIVVLKGIKMILMSALVQHGIYVLQGLLCGKKRAARDIEMAFDVKSKKNPLSG